MDDRFHTSLKELRLQLDLMNSRTASILNKPRQQSNMLTPDSSEVGPSPSVIADSMQQIKHIGATVGTLAKTQEDRFQTLERQLDALSDKLDDFILENPRFTPPESPSESDPASSRSDTASISSQNSTMPRSPRSDMAPATVADIGGYFYPNYVQHGYNGQQFISDASSFKGRVNRTLRTKSITNIEIFLRGPALRWFHIGLIEDGTHIFDNHDDEFDLARFFDSLILLFGVSSSIACAISIEDLPLTSFSMRSDIVEDYIFPALEYVRPQDNLFDRDSGATDAVRRALELYNQSSEPYTVSTEISDYIGHPDVLDCDDLLDLLGCLRRIELKQKLDRILSANQRIATDAAFTKVATEESKNEFLASRIVQQNPLSASVNNSDCKMSTLTPAESHDNHLQTREPTSLGIREQSCLFKALEEFETMAANSIASAIEPYPPAPTAESCPTTPIASCQPPSSNLNSESQTADVCEEPRIAESTHSENETQPMQDEATHEYAYADYLYGAGGIPMKESACDKIESQSSAPATDQCLESSHVHSHGPVLRPAVNFPVQGSDTSIRLGDSASTIAGLARWSQRAAEIKAKNTADQSQRMAGDTMRCFGNFVLDDSRLGLPTLDTETRSGQESTDIEAILDGTPLIQAPDAPSGDNNSKQKWYNEPEKDNSAPEANSLDIFEGADNCLAGLSFAFTGQLEHISREEVCILVRRYGGKITLAPSESTDYAVVGADVAPKKLARIEEHNLRVIDEQGFFNLISKLPAHDCPVPEQNKEAESLKNATEDVSAATITPHQEASWISTVESEQQPQQQPLEQQQITQTKRGFPLCPQAESFLNDFMVFPPTYISPTTPEWRNYQSSVRDRLTKLVANQESGLSRLKEVYENIMKPEGFGQTLSARNKLVGKSNNARSDVYRAKKDIEAICVENEKNCLAWAGKPGSPLVRKTSVAVATNNYFNLIDAELALLRPEMARSRKY